MSQVLGDGPGLGGLELAGDEIGQIGEEMSREAFLPGESPVFGAGAGGIAVFHARVMLVMRTRSTALPI